MSNQVNRFMMPKVTAVGMPEGVPVRETCNGIPIKESSNITTVDSTVDSKVSTPVAQSYPWIDELNHFAGGNFGTLIEHAVKGGKHTELQMLISFSNTILEKNSAQTRNAYSRSEFEKLQKQVDELTKLNARYANQLNTEDKARESFMDQRDRAHRLLATARKNLIQKDAEILALKGSPTLFGDDLQEKLNKASADLQAKDARIAELTKELEGCRRVVGGIMDVLK